MEDILVAFAVVGFFSVVFFAIRISVVERRLQNLIDQQEEYWQRHLENHPKGD